MYKESDKNRILNIYKNEVKKNLKRKFKVSNKKAEIGINKSGFEKDFLEYTDDYQFVEPERVAIEVFEDILEDKHIIKVKGKYVLGTIKKEPKHYGVIGTSKRNVIVGSPIKGSVGKRKRVGRAPRVIVVGKNKSATGIIKTVKSDKK